MLFSCRDHFHLGHCSGLFVSSCFIVCFWLTIGLRGLLLHKLLCPNYKAQYSDTSVPPCFSSETRLFCRLCTPLELQARILVLSIHSNKRDLYVGDYFGILMEDRVTSFPFNILEHPMYVGSTMSFFGTAFWYGKPVGFLLALEVTFMYMLAMFLEGPFTTKIYQLRDEYFRRRAEKEREAALKEE